MTTNNSTILDNKDHLLRIIDFVLSQSKKMGATDAEADIGAGIGLSANAVSYTHLTLPTKRIV